MSEIDSLVYWISAVQRVHAVSMSLCPILLLIFAAFLFLLNDASDKAKDFAMRWLWVLLVLQILNFCTIVFVPSQKVLAIMAKQRIHELNAPVSPKVEEYIDYCIEDKSK